MAAPGAKLRFRGRAVSFWCPGCRRAHIIMVSSDAAPDASAYVFDGNCDCPTFTPSIMINRPGPAHNPDAPVCHFFVTKGRILFLQDCTHELAGQTVTCRTFRYEQEQAMTTPTDACAVTAEELRQFIERAEQLRREKQELDEQEKELFAEARARGYDTGVMRKLIALRKRKPDDLAEEEATLEMYKAALGMG